MTDSKSVGSNTVRVRPPPSAPKKAGLCLNRHSPAFFGAGGRTRTVRVVHGCTIVLAPSFKQGCLKSAALSCHTMWQPKRLTRHDAKPTEQARRARMHDSGRTESAQGRADPNDRISTYLAALPLSQTGIALFFGAGRRTRTVRVRHECPQATTYTIFYPTC